MSVATAVASAEVLTEYRVLPLGDLHPHTRATSASTSET